ncbi:MAG: aminotransferase class III-fold pyridoxal phosphate-dependent enzyme [Acidobacteria bacterium]|nr:aminotransferase class III-fold pyridoxal phosphate-dependent enzyme [Acidobacteriota bacterium]
MDTADSRSTAGTGLAHAHDYPFLGQGRAPLEVAAAEGCYMITPTGRRILDAAGGAIVSNIGHGRREVAEAYAQAAAQTDYIVPPFATPARAELVHRMRTRWLPGDINRVLFASGGSEAMDLAIRFARQHHLSAGRPERWRVFGRQLSYHGATMATLAVGGHMGRRAGFEPWLVDEQTDQPRPPAHYCMRCPLGKTFPGCDIACADEVERVFEEIGPEEIAAFVVEPIVGSNAGALVPPGDYLERVARICRRHGILLIADEVMTGYGRTGRKFGVDHWDVVPDILVGGKGLTGGYAPLVAICAREEVTAPIAEAGDSVMFFTYGAHSPACAAATEVLRILEDEELVERAATVGAMLGERLRETLADHPHVAEVRGRGLLYGIEIVQDRETLEPFPAELSLVNAVVAAGLSMDVFFYPGGNDPARDVVCLGPPFILGEEEIEKIVTVLPNAIDSAIARKAPAPSLLGPPVCCD